MPHRVNAVEMVGQALKGAAINLIYFDVDFVLLQRGNWKMFSLGSKTHVISLGTSGFAVPEAHCEVCPLREGQRAAGSVLFQTPPYS